MNLILKLLILDAFHILKIERKTSPELIELLEENAIGTPGESMVYQHHDVPSKVETVSNPYFANLSIRNRLYGSICFSKREVYNLGKSCQVFYLRYFTFRESFRTANPKNHTRREPSKIREDIVRLLDGEGLDYPGDLILYAYVDTDNIRSKRLIDEFGFQKLSNFNVIPFSRLWPKRSMLVEIVEETYYKKIRAKLVKAYNSELFVSFESLFNRGNYFIIKEQGKLVCGVQAIPDQWDILEMPGAMGRILMNIVPKFPIINRLFNPTYKFVFLESMFCEDGYEHLLGSLFESVLQHYKVNSGILCLDQKSTMYAKVKKINLGLTHKMQGEKQIDVVVKTSDNKLITSNAPVSVSGFDVL